MTPREAMLAMAAAAEARREPGVRTMYSQRERALVEVLLQVLRGEGYFAAVRIFEKETDGLTKLAETEKSNEGV